MNIISQLEDKQTKITQKAKENEKEFAKLKKIGSLTSDHKRTGQ
jgi:uncharacterized protein YigA (DUF484 family)